MGGRDDGLPVSPRGSFVDLSSVVADGPAGKPRHRRRGSRESVGAETVSSGRSDDTHTVRSGFYLAPAPSLPRRWTRGDALGAGSFGSVFLGLNSDTGELFAVKEVTLDRRLDASRGDPAEAVEQLEREVDLLSRLQHPNIVRYVGIARDDDALYIFLEYVPGGSIASLLDRFGAFEESVAAVYASQIAVGLAYLHSQRTVHRDVKGANILVEKSGRIKLADFGMAKQIVEQMATAPGGRAGDAMAGSTFWMAPEVVKQQTHGAPADVWSVGCVVIEMLTGAPPWSDCGGQVQAIFKIGGTGELPTMPDWISDDARNFVSSCLRRRPDERPSAEDLLAHPFVAAAANAAEEVPALQYEGYWSQDDDGDDAETDPDVTSLDAVGRGMRHLGLEDDESRGGGGSVREGSVREGSVREGSVREGSVREGSVREDAAPRGSPREEPVRPREEPVRPREEPVRPARARVVVDWREEVEALRERFGEDDDDEEGAGTGVGETGVDSGEGSCELGAFGAGGLLEPPKRRDGASSAAPRPPTLASGTPE